MNDYRITYSTDGEEQESIVTERSECTARNNFKKAHKGETYDILTIDLVRENTCATKQQERDTLAAIRKMVEELGPQSYLATAFEGCFEDAEANIENDFADSYKQRCESATKRLEQAMETIAQLKSDIQLLSSELENERAYIKNLEQRTFSADTLATLNKMVADKCQDLSTTIEDAAKCIVELADNPANAEFQNAVSNHRTAQARLNRYKAIQTAIAQAKSR